MKELSVSELNIVVGGHPIAIAAMWLGRAGAVGSLGALAYYFYER
ncbi:hypothetical protein [Ferrimonas balearica]|nr:hypothetical protein [Ferrimonas balearica]